MTTTDWVLVAGFVAGGFIIGAIASRLVTVVLSSPSRPKPRQGAARPLSSLFFWIGVTIGLLAALGVIQPSAVTQMQADLIAFLPRIMAAAIIFILGNVLASFVEAALAQLLGRSSASVQRQVLGIARAVIVALASLLAVTQLGINTDILNLTVAAALFGGALSLALLVGVGGRQVAGEVAASRAVWRLIGEGDTVEIDGHIGQVVGVHPTAVELSTRAGETVLVPSSHLLTESVVIRRRQPGPDDSVS